MPLSVCATPIGNLEDVTLRVLTVLAACDTVLCEDTRRTRILLGRHGIRARLLSYREHNEAARVAELLPRLGAGEHMALVSDAGLPGISDPGARLIDAALAAGIVVTVLPGPSAVETALVASGLGSGPYRFLGYLPRRPAELEALWDSLGGCEDTAVAFESPKRVVRSLASLADLDPKRVVCVCRELTKLHEEVVRGPVADVMAQLAGEVRGEITIVIAANPDGRHGDDAPALLAVAELVAAGASRSTASAVVARLTGRSRNELYRRTL